MHVQNWDDYRFVAVLARAGSLAEASVLLGVDRSTVQRRIKSLESQLGYPLFLRTGGRYRALPEANPSLSLTASLGITFPFNILFGIPLYLLLAEYLMAWGN